MVHISKKQLPDTTVRAIIDELADELHRTKKKSEVRTLLYELLSKSERTQLAKRLALISLLESDTSPMTVARVLNVSSSTVGIFAEKIDRGDFSQIRSHARERMREQTFVGAIEKILSFGQESIAGKNRWKNF